MSGPYSSPWTAVLAISGGSGAVVVTIIAIPDQSGLTPVSLVVTVTVAGVPTIPSAVAWKVNGTTVGIADAGANPTTHTPPAAGSYTATCAVSVGGGTYQAAGETYLVGDGDGRVSTHYVDWKAGSLAGSKTIGGSEVIDGITIDYTTGGGGAPTIVAGPTGLVMTPNGASALSYEWLGADLGDSSWSIGQSWVLYVAMNSSLVASGDNRTFGFIQGTNRVYARFHYNGGYKVAIAMIRGGVNTETVFSLGSHPRMIALNFDGTVADARWSGTPYAGAFPAFSSMTKCMVLRTGNRFAAFDPSAVDSAEVPAIAGSTVRFTVQGGACVVEAHEIRWAPAR